MTYSDKMDFNILLKNYTESQRKHMRHAFVVLDNMPSSFVSPDKHDCHFKKEFISQIYFMKPEI